MFQLRPAISNACRIFWLRVVRQTCGGPFLEGRDQIFLLGEALKFGGIFQRFALKLLKLLSRKFLKNLMKFFYFLSAEWEK